MESSRNYGNDCICAFCIIKGGQNGVKSQLLNPFPYPTGYYKGGAKWSQVAT